MYNQIKSGRTGGGGTPNRHNHFKNASCYYEWRAHWRMSYRRLSNQIASVKDRVKYGANPRLYQGVLVPLRMEAHSMMIAREAVTEQYKRDKLSS